MPLDPSSTFTLPVDPVPVPHLQYSARGSGPAFSLSLGLSFGLGFVFANWNVNPDPVAHNRGRKKTMRHHGLHHEYVFFKTMYKND